MQVRLASVAENSFNAVERIDEFTQTSQEKDTDIDGSKPDGWPPSGKVCPVSVNSLVNFALAAVVAKPA